MYLSRKRETGKSHTGFPSLASIRLFAAYLIIFIFYLLFTESWLKLIYLRYVGHVGWVGICRLNMRRMNCKNGLLCCWETILWRLRIRGRCHGWWGWREPRMVNGWLLLWTGQMESLGGLVLMVLNRTGCRVTPTMLTLLLSSGGSWRLRMWSMWVQGSIRMCILLSKGASGNWSERKRSVYNWQGWWS